LFSSFPHEGVQVDRCRSQVTWLSLFLMTSKSLTHRDYSMGWICAVTEKQAAITIGLDQKHLSLVQSSNDDNIYTLVSIDGHNVVLASSITTL
jgi:hypothetical protein